jgi:hypothetical protein
MPHRPADLPEWTDSRGAHGPWLLRDFDHKPHLFDVACVAIHQVGKILQAFFWRGVLVPQSSCGALISGRFPLFVVAIGKYGLTQLSQSVHSRNA